MDLASYLLIGAVAYSLALGLVVLKRNSKSPENIWFFVSAAAASFWVLTNLLVDHLGAPLLVLWAAKLTIVGPIILGPSFFIFSFIFSNPKRNFTFLEKLLILISFLFMAILVPTTYNITSLKSVDGRVLTTVGPLYYLFAIYFISYLISSLFYLIKAYFKERGLKKQQLKFVLWGALLTGAFGITINLVLLLLGYSEYSSIGPISVVFYFTLVSYAIAKHKLMDIRMVIARSVTYALLLLAMAGFYGAAIVAAQSLIFPEATSSAGYVALQIALAVIMAFSFQPLRKWLTKVTDKIFFKNEYDPEQFLDTVSHTMGSTIVLVELLFKTLALIRSQIKVTRGVMVVLSDTGAVFNSQSFGYGGALQIDAEDMVKLSKDGTLVLDELEEHSHYKRLLRKYDAALAVPIRTESSTEGVLLLGEKLSGDMYGAQDLRVFEIIAPELAVAITNAKAFEKIEKFNVTLRQEVKKATSELEKKNEQLRELDKAKDEFISMASHQLRTPLTAIKGYLSMLLEGDAGEIKVSQYDFVNEAFQGANRMVGLINDLLNVSRMETGRFFLEPVEVDLDKIIQEEMKQLSNHAKEKKLAFKYEKKGKVPKITADETKIRQVVMNFMDNAIYYTTKGSVTVTLRCDKTNVIYEVSDTGIGVPKAQQKNLFTKFYRADNARHVRPDGTGLGIYLAKRVLDDHGGQLIFHSKEGEGSTFGFKFPIHCKMTIKRASAPTPGAPGGPALGELAAGIGVNPAVLEATQSAGLEAPLCDSPDKKDLEKEVLEESASK